MKNIVENNKLLAEFLGHSLFDGINYYEPRDMKFHNNWNYLMQVVEKIKNISYGNIEIMEVVCSLRNKSITYWDNELYITQNILEVYEDALEFVKWYNEQK